MELSVSVGKDAENCCTRTAVTQKARPVFVWKVRQVAAVTDVSSRKAGRQLKQQRNARASRNGEAEEQRNRAQRSV